MVLLALTGWLTYTLAAFGLAFVLGHAKVSLGLRGFVHENLGWIGRFLVELIECPACLGFWIGLCYGFLFHPPFVPPGTHGVVVLALATAGSNFILGRKSGLIREGEA